jgi:hypothetical protein
MKHMKCLAFVDTAVQAQAEAYEWSILSLQATKAAGKLLSQNFRIIALRP